MLTGLRSCLSVHSFIYILYLLSILNINNQLCSRLRNAECAYTLCMCAFGECVVCVLDVYHQLCRLNDLHLHQMKWNNEFRSRVYRRHDDDLHLYHAQALSHCCAVAGIRDPIQSIEGTRQIAAQAHSATLRTLFIYLMNNIYREPIIFSDFYFWYWYKCKPGTFVP